MRKLTTILSVCLIFSLTLLFSCKKDDDNTTPGSTGKTVKLTFTVNGVNAESDYVSFVAVGGASDRTTNTVWKVNGVTRSNEQGISLGKNDFTGTTKTYVIESVVPLDLVKVGIQCINFDAPYVLSYTAEVDGKVVTSNQNVSVETNKDYTHDFTY